MPGHSGPMMDETTGIVVASLGCDIETCQALKPDPTALQFPKMVIQIRKATDCTFVRGCDTEHGATWVCRCPATVLCWYLAGKDSQGYKCPGPQNNCPLLNFVQGNLVPDSQNDRICQW